MAPSGETAAILKATDVNIILELAGTALIHGEGAVIAHIVGRRNQTLLGRKTKPLHTCTHRQIPQEDGKGSVYKSHQGIVLWEFQPIVRGYGCQMRMYLGSPQEPRIKGSQVFIGESLTNEKARWRPTEVYCP